MDTTSKQNPTTSPKWGFALPIINGKNLRWNWTKTPLLKRINKVPSWDKKNKQFVNHLSADKKTDLPRLTFTDGAQTCIVLDFDKLDLLQKAAKTKLSDWDIAYLYLRERFSSIGCVLRSPSGKVKVVVPVKNYKSYQLKNIKTAQFISKNLTKELYPAIDNSLAGLTLMYINGLLKN